MKQIIRLTEGDLHHMVRSIINEVLDGMDDTEKAYWLMRQRQQRPNTKSRTKTDYPREFAKKFNREFYGNGDKDYDGIYVPDIYDTHSDGTPVKGKVGVDPTNGNLFARQRVPNATIDHPLNFDYVQRPTDGNTYDEDFITYPKGIATKSEPIYKDYAKISPKMGYAMGDAFDRYNDIDKSYMQQRWEDESNKAMKNYIKNYYKNSRG